MAHDNLLTIAEAQGATHWSRFLYWSGRFFDMDDADAIERDYKIEVEDRVVAARDALEQNDPEWVDRLHDAIALKPNNLTSWRQTQPLEAWFREEPDNAALAFRLLWNRDLIPSERFNQFAEVAQAGGVKAPIAETSFFHMALGLREFPVFRSTPMDRAMELTRYPLPKETGIASGDIGGRYQHFLIFLDVMLKKAAETGIGLRDRLDAQGMAWMVTQWLPRESWSEEEKQAFLAYQGEAKSRKPSWKPV